MIASSVIRWAGDGVRGLVDGKYQIVKAPFRPYFFIKDVDAVALDIETYQGVIGDERTDLKTADTKEKVYKVICRSPDCVGKVRRQLESIGCKTYEADISYSRRAFIDKGFTVDYSDKNIVYLDIELDDSHGFRNFGEMAIISYAVYFPHLNKYVFSHVDDYDASRDGDAEWSMLFDLYKSLSTVSVIVGWNVNFDFNHLVKRIDLLRREGGVKRRGINLFDLSLTYRYDLRDEYKKIVKGLVSYSLGEVAGHEGVGNKIERSIKVSEMKYSELKEYNIRDVEILVEIEKKYGFVRRDCYLCKEVNLPMDYAKVAGVLGDSIVLRRLRELGYVAPNVVMHKKKGYSGALILEPKHGLHENIVAVDVVSLYPTAILDLNVDILDFAGQVLPYYVAYFFRRKMEEEEKGNRIGRETYKILANAIYGMFGYERFRFFDESKAELVTKKGREVLLKMVDVVKDIGFEVVYGDTDSIFIKPEGVGDVKAIVDYMNSQIRPYRVSLDMVFDKIIFFGSGEKGVKKRYIGVSGDKWKVRGIEVRRGDWSQFSKDVIWDVVKMIFGGCSKRDVETYLANVKSKLYRGYYDSKLLMVKSIQDSKKYKVEPAHFKLWKWGVSAGLIPSYSIEVEYYYKRGSKSGGLSLGLWCEVDKRFDYDEYWRKQVLAPVNRIVESVWGSRIIDVGGGLGLENYI